MKYKNQWLYSSTGEKVFITCDNDKQSINHLLEGVGLFTLNETCKAYATRDILIPGEVNFQEEYLDLIPDSKINNINTLMENQLNDESQYKNIQGNQMEDLNNIAKPLREITEKSEGDRKMQQIRKKQIQSDYLLYFMTTLILLGSVIFITIKINIIIKRRQIQNADKQEKEEELPLQPTTVVEKTS